ncbi:MAG: TonB-dependent receptor [Cyclobacteriaceae bacterium]
MRVSLLNLIIALCTMQVLMARHAAGQGLDDINVTVELKNEDIKTLFRKIEKQSRLRFAYDPTLVRPYTDISLPRETRSIKATLDLVLEGTPLRYRQVDNSVIIYIELGEKISDVEPIQGVLVTGTVKEASTQELLPGVNIIQKGTTQGTTTDADGKYSLLVAEDDAILVFSFIGYITQEVALNGRSVIDVVLTPDIKTLEEVVVVGYGSTRKENVLQGVSSIKAEKVAEIPAANLAQTLAGRMPGLFITQSGGKPGRASVIRVRAYDGFGSSQPPLFVIDGVIVDQFAFDALDATEVDNVSVLKDGASSAIYGVRGANGVIVVTTKRGKKGPPQINYISSYSIDEATKVPETLSAYDEAVFINDYLKQTDPNYQNNAAFFADDELEYWKTNETSLIDKYFIRPTQLRNTLNISGGGDRINYFVSASHYKGTGSFNNVEYQKFNFRSKVEAQITDDLSVSVNLSSDVRNDEKPFWRWDADSDDFTDFYNGLLTRGKMAPDYINVDGKDYPVGNLMKWHPGEVVNGNTGYNRKKWTDYQAIFEVAYNVPFVKGMELRAKYAKYSRHDFRKELNLPYKLYTFNTLGSKNHIVGDQIDFSRTFERNDGNWAKASYSSNDFYQLNFFVNYDRSFGQHNVSAVAVYEQSETHNHNFSARNQFILSPALDQLSLGSSDSKNDFTTGEEFEDGRLSALGRVSYNYANQYFLEAAFRYEGSRYFIPSNRYAFFPSISAGWRISEAGFFKDNIKFINDLKIRGSLGFTGEEPGGGQIQWSQSFRKATGAVFGGGTTDGITVGTLPNPDITWAKKRSFDLGLDAALLNNRLTLSVDVFKNRRKDILGARTQSIPSTFGASLPAVNYGIVESEGIEFDLGYRTRPSKEVSFFSSFNFGYATNKQVLIDQASNIRPYQNQIGYNTGRIFGLIATDIIRTQADLDKLPSGYTINGATPRLGMLNFKDIRGATSDEPDGKIDGNDQEFIAKYSFPPITYGLTVGATWRGLSVDVFFQGLSKFYKARDVRGHSAQEREQEAGSFAFWKDHWSPENPNAKYPIYANLGGNSAVSTFWLDNASFIRLKNLNIGYALPDKLIQKIKFQGVKLFFNGSNLFLLKDKIKWYDPEGNIKAYPINRSYTIGLNVTL